MELKICIMTTVHSGSDTRVFHKQARTLCQAGHTVVLIAQQAEVEDACGVEHLFLAKPRSRLHRMVISTWRAYAFARRQSADVYHLHDPELIPAGVLLKLRTRKRVFYDVHEDYCEVIRTREWLPRWLRRCGAEVFKWLESASLRHFDAVIAATDDIGRLYPGDRTVVVKNYPFLPSERECAGEDALQETAGSGHPVLIYVGGLARARGIHEIVKAMEYVDDRYGAELRLIGRFSDTAFERQIKSLDGFKWTTHVGWLPYDAVLEQLESADVALACLHPEKRYLTSEPNKLFEYMAAGLPIVLSDFPLWRRIADEAQCGLTVDPLRPAEIARAVSYLLEHPAEAKVMGRRGREAVEEKYNWDIEAEKLLAVYSGLGDRI